MGNAPHLIGGQVGDSGRVFVGAFGEGVTTFDFTRADTSGLAGYHSHPGILCARILVAPGKVYCTAHDDGSLSVYDYDPAANTLLNPQSIHGPSAGLEGMTRAGSQVLVAARTAGLLALDTSGPAPQLIPAAPPPAVADAWDVSPLGTDTVVVASGTHGLQVLQHTPGGSTYTPLGQLSLPGVSVAVRVAGTRAYVSALSGGGHVVDLAHPATPTLLGTLAAGRMVYDLLPVGNLVLAAAGDTLIAGSLSPTTPPGTTPPAPIPIVGEHRSTGIAMGWVPMADGTVLGLEFDTATQYQLHPEAASTTVLHIPAALAVPGTRGAMTFPLEIPVRNVGTGTVHVSGIQGDTVVPLPTGFGGPFDVAPGTTRRLQLPVQVSLSNGHLRGVEFNTPGLDNGWLPIESTASLQPGDLLSSTGLTWIQADGTPFDLTGALAGKVSVLIVGSTACPVAYYGLTAAGQVLAPYLSDGRIAAVSVDGWRLAPSGPQAMSPLHLPFPHVYLNAPAGTDLHANSPVLNQWGQQSAHGAPMPDVYVLGRDGRVTYAAWRLDPVGLTEAIETALQH